jgi:cytochrome b561
MSTDRLRRALHMTNGVAVLLGMVVFTAWGLWVPAVRVLLDPDWRHARLLIVVAILLSTLLIVLMASILAVGMWRSLSPARREVSAGLPPEETTDGPSDAKRCQD